MCWFCGHDRDTAQHTLEECPQWAGEREELVAKVGRDLSLPKLVEEMEEDQWRAVSFCETVMVQKEEKEREREVSGRRARGSPEPRADVSNGGSPPSSPPPPRGPPLVGGGRGGARTRHPRVAIRRGMRGGDV